MDRQCPKKELVYGEGYVVQIYAIVDMYHTASTDLLNVQRA